MLNSIRNAEITDIFVKDQISDLGFSFEARTLPSKFSKQAARNTFLVAQKRVLSYALDLETGPKHHHFQPESDVPLLSLAELGKGGFGRVDRVRSGISFREYARKIIPRGSNFRKDKEILRGFENEVRSLRKITHHHIITFVGSYTDPRSVGILIAPVADCKLQQYLDGAFEPSLVRNFFGCLAIAVCFLHESNVRHKDIKPQNILVYQSRVLLPTSV